MTHGGGGLSTSSPERHPWTVNASGSLGGGNQRGLLRVLSAGEEEMDDDGKQQPAPGEHKQPAAGAAATVSVVFSAFLCTNGL